MTIAHHVIWAENPITTPQQKGLTTDGTDGIDSCAVLGGFGTLSSASITDRTAWDATSGTDPTIGGNSLGLSGHHFATTTDSAIILGGRASYYSAAIADGADDASLTLTYGGDNSNAHLAGMCLAMHSDLNVGLASDGVTPKGSHGGIFGGSFHQVSGDYSVSVGGQMKQVFALQSGAFAGRNHLLGSLANVDAVRRCVTLGGLTLEIVAGLESAILAGQRNTITDGDRSAIVGGEDNEIASDYSVILGGQDCKTTAAQTVVSGRDALAEVVNAQTQSCGAFAAKGDNQVHRIAARRTFTGLEGFLSVDGGSGTDLFTPPANSVGTFNLDINVIRMDGAAPHSANEGASYNLRGAFSNLGGTLTVKAQTLTVDYEDDAGYTVAAEIFGTGTRLGARLTTPDAGHTTRWTASGSITVQSVR